MLRFVDSCMRVPGADMGNVVVTECGKSVAIEAVASAFANGL